jgi:hypothetical protein
VIPLKNSQLAGIGKGIKVTVDRDVPTLVRLPMQEIGFKWKHESLPLDPLFDLLEDRCKIDFTSFGSAY